MINNAMQAVYFRRHKFWMKWDDTRKGDVSDNIKKYHAMRQKRFNPKHTIMKAEARKKMWKHRNERDAEGLIAHVDDLHRDRDDDAQDFGREQARERLNLEYRRQDDR
ncbi:MAG: hypothetical protein GXP00_10605 [Alphaproteobacteria bacterium]|nr:hypothetical protein [Alphaproteobacteria bacterium]